MAEGTEEEFMSVDKQHIWGQGTFPRQVSSQVTSFMQLRRERISEIIRSGTSDITDFRALLNNESSRVLAEHDSNGRNVMMETIHSKNVPLLAEICSLLRGLAVSGILYKSEDKDGNNCLQLALKTDSEKIVNLVWDNIVTSNTGTQTISDMITHRNFAEENAYTIALSSKHGYNWIQNYFTPRTNLTKDSVNTLWMPNNRGESTIVKAVFTDNLDIACELVGHVLRLCKDKMGDIYRKRTISVRNNRETVHPGGDDPQDVDICLLDLLMMKRETTNEREIDQLIMYYAVDLFESKYPHSPEAFELYRKIVSPRRVGEKSLFSILLQKSCHQVVKSLLDTVQFRNTFWQQIDAPDSLFTRSYLETHAMDSKMVSMLHAPPADKFLKLSNHSKARPQALMFYTEMHTVRHQASTREGATEECQDLRVCLEEIGIECGVLSGENTCIRKANIMYWLENELFKKRDLTSMLIIAGFCHGEEGILFDSDMDPIAIRDIVSLANTNMYTGIPICFMLQACRIKPAIGLPPSVGLQRYNVLIRTCGEGENSFRGVYTGEFAQRVRSGGRDIQKIHQDVVHFIVNHPDNNIRTQTPELTHLLTKNELCLPN